jgi:hypothetical protein
VTGNGVVMTETQIISDEPYRQMFNLAFDNLYYVFFGMLLRINSNTVALHPSVRKELRRCICDLRSFTDVLNHAVAPVEYAPMFEMHRLHQFMLDEIDQRMQAGDSVDARHLAVTLMDLIALEIRWLWRS